jgi:nucleotide-binding universal stress UspA family protein
MKAAVASQLESSNAHIVVGVDGSETALHAVEWAAHEARRHGLPLRLVACYSVPFFGEPGMIGGYAIESQVEAIRAEHEGYAHAAAARAWEQVPALAIDSIVTLASPTVSLPRVVERGGVLVVGSSGHAGAIAGVIGSVATAVSHHTNAPVVVVPMRSTKKGSSMKKIVVGTDGSESALEAVRWAYEEARLANAELVVLHGWEYPYPDVSGDGDEVSRRMQRDAAAQLDSSLATLRAESDAVTVTSCLVENSPAAALIDASEDADLVVVGSRGRGGFASMLLGSVSRAVVQHAACPVAVIRHPSH